jgi:hypothetical protein
MNIEACPLHFRNSRSLYLYVVDGNKAVFVTNRFYSLCIDMSSLKFEVVSPIAADARFSRFRIT